MRTNLLVLLVALFLIFAGNIEAKNKKCYTMYSLSKAQAKDPKLIERMLANEMLTQKYLTNQKSKKSAQEIITIPVVVHVIWNTEEQNVSDVQIQSQIDILNEDFRLLNQDKLNENHPFYSKIADAEIQFCLAKQDPIGNATNGITRTQTNIEAWGDEILDNIKSTENGGKDNWDPQSYMNLYVVKLAGETLGFATFPDELATAPKLDGVVIRYEAFGKIGTAGTGDFAANKGGRTGTHEVGHWLNLRHIWADDTCANDFVDDTEPAVYSNYGCPEFPHRANSQCGTGEFGEMYMNYMDYVDDQCMNMFTKGQSERMRAALNMGRVGLLTSKACEVPSSINYNGFEENINFYPNPSNGVFSFDINEDISNNSYLTISSLLGEKVHQRLNLNYGTNTIDCGQLNAGIYLVLVSNGKSSTIQKIVINK